MPIRCLDIEPWPGRILSSTQWFMQCPVTQASLYEKQVLALLLCHSVFCLHIRCHAATRLYPDLPLRSIAQSALLATLFN